MTDPIVPLLGFCLWTRTLVAVTAAGRSLLALSGRARADDFPAYQYDSSRFLDCAARAYLLLSGSYGSAGLESARGLDAAVLAIAKAACLGYSTPPRAGHGFCTTKLFP